MKKQLHGQDIFIFHNPAAIANKTKVEWAEIEAALMSNCSYSGPVLNSLQRWVSLLTKQQQLLGEAARGASHPQVKCHQGLAEYGGLAQRYVREFDQKWLRGRAPTDEPLVGSGDIQSLADLGNSFEIGNGMKPVPFGKDTLLQLALISLAPVAPLVLTMIPLGELLDRFLHVVF